MSETDAPGIEAAWHKLEDDWQSDESHRRFLTLCARHGALDEAGRRYRAVRDRDPLRREEASLRLSAVMALALEELAKTRSPGAPRKRRLMWLLVGACGFVVIRTVLALLHLRSH